MKFLKMIFGVVAVIAITTICGTKAIPKPQDLEEVDGFAFDGPIDRSGPFQSTNNPLIEPEPTTPTPSSTSIISASSTTPTSNTPAVDPTGPTQPVTLSPELAQCIQNCQFRVTSEFNPVCGSDRSVYKNPGTLNCAKGCGHDVDQAYVGPCSSQIRG